MVLITDIVLQFITSELVPRIVSKTVELSKKGSSIDDIVKEICSFHFNDVLKGSVKRSVSSKAPTATTKTSTAATIDEYMEKYKDSQVCTYVYSRGENKGKICCKQVTSSTYNKDDEKTQRCTTHEDGNPGPGLESLMSKSKTPSKKDQADKVRKTFPKGAPEVLNTSTESKTLIGLGKISIKDQLQKDALKIDSKTPTPLKDRETTPQPSKRKLPPKTDASVKARVVSPTPPKDRMSTPDSKIATRDQTPTPVKSRTPSPEPRSSSSSCNQTPLSKDAREKEHPPSPASSHRESTPDDSEAHHVIPKDENDEEYFLNPTQPSAQDYLWMMYSKNEAVIFSKEFDACYGVYRTDEEIDPDKDFKISSAWKKLLKPPSSHQETFVTDRGIEIKSID